MTKIRILLADDDEVNRNLLGRLLESHGFEQRGFASGEDLLKAWESDDWDLILLDVEMPGMSGHETARAIRAKEQVSKKHIPMIGLTAARDQGELDACLKAGMDHAFKKPLKVSDLADFLNSVFKAREYSFDELVKSEDNDREFAQELIAIYLKNEVAYLNEFQTAIRDLDAGRLKAAAHKIRGSLSIIRADESLIQMLREIEDRALADNLTDCEDLFARTSLALHAFGEGIKKL